jgi:S-adenosylmethionine decarboxylase
VGNPTKGTRETFEIVQLLVDLYRCDSNLDDAEFLLGTLERAADEVGAKVIRKVTQRFSPQGVSVILILAETHLSIHTWPEHGYAAVDIFICGEGKDPEVAWKVIRETLKPSSFRMNKINRTVGPRK